MQNIRNAISDTSYQFGWPHSSVHSSQAFRQTPRRQSRDPGLKIQRHSEACRSAVSRSVARTQGCQGIAQTTLCRVSHLDGPGVSAQGSRHIWMAPGFRPRVPARGHQSSNFAVSLRKRLRVVMASNVVMMKEGAAASSNGLATNSG